MGRLAIAVLVSLGALVFADAALKTALAIPRIGAQAEDGARW